MRICLNAGWDVNGCDLRVMRIPGIHAASVIDNMTERHTTDRHASQHWYTRMYPLYSDVCTGTNSMAGNVAKLGPH